MSRRRLWVTPHAGRVIAWIAALGLTAFVLGGLNHQGNEAARDRDALRVLANQTRHNAAVATDALCSLRHEREKTVANAERFLREHPNGTHDIPAETIRTSIATQRGTIQSLSDLSC
jgi:hypothetical protein